MANFFCRSRPTITWAASTVYALGNRRLSTGTVPAKGIHFEVTTAGTSGGAEPAWNTTVGGTTTDNTVTWTTRGSADTWVASTAYVVGDRVVATTAATATRQSRVFECTTAGTSGTTEPLWNVNVGGTQADNTVTWTVRSPNVWDNAHILLQSITTVSGIAVAGDTIFVGDEHAQSQAVAITISTNAGTSTDPIKVLCVNDTGDPASPTSLADSAVVTTTGASSITFNLGFCYFRGITFNAGTGAVIASINLGTGKAGLVFEKCAFKLVATSSSSTIALGSGTAATAVVLKWINTTVQFSSTSQEITHNDCNFEWLNTPSALVLGSVPTRLIDIGRGSLKLHGVDLTNFTAAVLGVTSSSLGSTLASVYNCKFGSGATLTNGDVLGISGDLVMINSDSGATNTNIAMSTGQAALTDELTIVRTGGASDGTTPFAWRIVTTSTLPRFEFPFISMPITQWNNTTGVAKTLTIEIINDGLILTDKEVWVEVEYLGSSSSPLSSFVNDAATDLLATATNQTTSTVGWTTTGLASPSKQKLEVTFTPQLKGPVIARVFVARLSTTLFIDPVATIT